MSPVDTQGLYYFYDLIPRLFMGKSGESDGHSSLSVLGKPRLDRSHASAPSLLFPLTWHLFVVILFLQRPAQPQLLKIDLSHIALCTGGCPCFLFDLTCNYQFLEAVGLPWSSFFPLGRGCEQFVSRDRTVSPRFSAALSGPVLAFCRINHVDL